MFSILIDQIAYFYLPSACGRYSGLVTGISALEFVGIERVNTRLRHYVMFSGKTLFQNILPPKLSGGNCKILKGEGIFRELVSRRSKDTWMKVLASYQYDMILELIAN